MPTPYRAVGQQRPRQRQQQRGSGHASARHAAGLTTAGLLAAIGLLCLAGSWSRRSSLRSFVAAGGVLPSPEELHRNGVVNTRRELLSALGLTTAGLPLSSSLAEEVSPVSTATASGPSYDGVATFLGKPKVLVAGSTGELGRRVVLDLLRSGFAVRAGIRDLGRAAEVQYANRKTNKYELEVIQNCLVETGRQKQLEEAIGDASVVINVAGARFGFDIFRPGLGLDVAEPERTDLNGTKALIDAAVARGVRKFVQVSAVLTNARALGEDNRNEFTSWNSFGNVLDCKHEAEAYLQKSGLDYTLIRPAPMTNDFPNQVGGMKFLKPDSILLKSGEPGNRISREDVADACMDAIFNSKARGVFELVGAPGKPSVPKERWWDLAA